MHLSAIKLGKRYNLEWIFRNLDLTFESGRSYAITGANGSGKSTLLQVLSGFLPASEGTVTYSHEGNEITPDIIYRSIGIAAPYQELIEEFTLREQVGFHLKFKKFKEHLSGDNFIKKLQLERSQDKEIRFFSSGMKQRLKLGLAIFSDTPLLLLDEPTTNLDEQGIDWYHNTISQYKKDRLVIVCSNQRYEYDFCDAVVSMGNKN